jgi:hypothetical protein
MLLETACRFTVRSSLVPLFPAADGDGSLSRVEPVDRASHCPRALWVCRADLACVLVRVLVVLVLLLLMSSNMMMSSRMMMMSWRILSWHAALAPCLHPPAVAAGSSRRAHAELQPELQPLVAAFAPLPAAPSAGVRRPVRVCVCAYVCYLGGRDGVPCLPPPSFFCRPLHT